MSFANPILRSFLRRTIVQQQQPLAFVATSSANLAIRTTKIEPPNEPFENVVQPAKHRIAVVPKVPHIWITSPIKTPRGTKELYRMMGEELNHNRLLLQQFGIVAIHGGNMEARHFEVLRNKIGRKVDPKNSFAIWRADAPYKPVTRMGQGKRHGGGKGGISHYMTPIKAGRVILEVGGKVMWEEVQPWLSKVAELLPFEAIAVNQDLIDRLNKEEKRLMEEDNTNPITFEWLIRNNIRDCGFYTSPYDQKWFGKFVYKDRTLNKKWNIVRQSRYKSR